MPDKRPPKRQPKRKEAQPRRSSARTEAPRAEKSKTASSAAGDSALTYEPNPKHKEPWQRGARGTLCPRDADGPALLATSQVDPKHPGKRYATDGTLAYSGHEHTTDHWHGFLVQWRKVPASIRNAWLAEGRVKARSVKEYW
jgi:hypothetical protein